MKSLTFFNLKFLQLECIQDVFDFYGIELDVSHLVIPPSYLAKWKIYIEVTHTTKGRNGNVEELKDCHLLRGEVELYILKKTPKHNLLICCTLSPLSSEITIIFAIFSTF